MVPPKQSLFSCQEAFCVDIVVQCKATETHLNVKVLGWNDFAALAQKSDIPVFALGGVAPEDLEQAQKHNAYGLAGIRQFSSI